MSERELSLDERKAVLKILLLDAMKLWRMIVVLNKKNVKINWRTDPESYDKNYQEIKRLDVIRIKKSREAESIFLSLTKEQRDQFLLELKPQLMGEEEFEHVRSAMEWNTPEQLAKTISYVEKCELLGNAVREQWTNKKLRAEFRKLIKQKWGAEALEGAKIEVSVKPPKLSYEGIGPQLYVDGNDIKEDGSMYTEEENAARILKALRGGKKEDEN